MPIISYVYTRPIASKKINYKHVLRDLSIDDFKSKPPDCTCASSPFIYNPTGHVITGDLTIINKRCSPKGLNTVSLKSINWKHNFKILTDSVEDYASQWAKPQALGSRILSILSIKCASTTYMNPFDMLRCGINAFMNNSPFS